MTSTFIHAHRHHVLGRPFHQLEARGLVHLDLVIAVGPGDLDGAVGADRRRHVRRPGGQQPIVGRPGRRRLPVLVDAAPPRGRSPRSAPPEPEHQEPVDARACHTPSASSPPGCAPPPRARPPSGRRTRSASPAARSPPGSRSVGDAAPGCAATRAGARDRRSTARRCRPISPPCARTSSTCRRYQLA